MIPRGCRWERSEVRLLRPGTLAGAWSGRARVTLAADGAALLVAHSGKAGRRRLLKVSSTASSRWSSWCRSWCWRVVRRARPGRSRCLHRGGRRPGIAGVGCRGSAGLGERRRARRCDGGRPFHSAGLQGAARRCRGPAVHACAAASRALRRRSAVCVAASAARRASSTGGMLSSGAMVPRVRSPGPPQNAPSRQGRRHWRRLTRPASAWNGARTIACGSSRSYSGVPGGIAACRAPVRSGAGDRMTDKGAVIVSIPIGLFSTKSSNSAFRRDSVAVASISWLILRHSPLHRMPSGLAAFFGSLCLGDGRTQVPVSRSIFSPPPRHSKRWFTLNNSARANRLDFASGSARRPRLRPWWPSIQLARHSAARRRDGSTTDQTEDEGGALRAPG
jgi:hypothetical protein